VDYVGAARRLDPGTPLGWTTLLKDLPDVYDEVKFEAALAAVYEHVYESYWGDGKSLYVEEAVTAEANGSAGRSGMKGDVSP
jgi:hypothetical protein